MAFLDAFDTNCESAVTRLPTSCLANTVASAALFSFVALTVLFSESAALAESTDEPHLAAPGSSEGSSLPDSSTANESDLLRTPTDAIAPAVAEPPPAVAEPTPALTRATEANQDTLRASAPPSRPFRLYDYIGLGLDMGISGPLPDAGLLLIGRPVNWVHLQVGPTTNFLAFGLRGGLTLVNPFFVPLSVTCEAGHFFEGNANDAKHWVSNDNDDIAALHDFSYDYVNLLGGIVLGGRHMMVVVRAGTTWMRANVHNFQRTVYDASKIEIQSSDPKFSYRGPSLRLGLVFFL